MIKPIPTHYNGYHFRSRTEARWAVFFDNLGIAYEYELEGYDLGQAGYYLPDFYLPATGYFYEVKGCVQMVSAEENAKVEALNRNPPGGTNGCKFLIGAPSSPEYVSFLVWFLLPNNATAHLLHDLAKHKRYAGRDVVKAVQAARSERFENGR